MRTKVTDLHPKKQWFGANGIIHLPQGMVVVDRDWRNTSGGGFTTLSTSCRGKYYIEKHNFWYSQRFCTTLAKRFMAEVIEMSKQGK